MKTGDELQTQEHLRVRKGKGGTGLQEHDGSICSPVSMLAVRDRQGKAGRVLSGEGKLSTDDVENVKGVLALNWEEPSWELVPSLRKRDRSPYAR